MQDNKLVVDFSRAGNAGSFMLTGWSGQESDFVWTLGPRSTIAMPRLHPEANTEIEVDVAGFDGDQSLPLMFRVGSQVVGDFRVKGRQRVRFQLPPGAAPGSGAVLEIEHPAYRPSQPHVAGARELAFCFRRMTFAFVREPMAPSAAGNAAAVLLVGNSHIDVLRQAHARQVAAGNGSLEAWDFVRLPPGWHDAPLRKECHPLVVEEIRQFAAERNSVALFSAIYGNGHFVFGATQHPVPFDFFLPGHESIGVLGDRDVVPYSLVRKKALRSTQRSIGMLSVLRHCIGIPTYHLSSPPPGTDNTLLARRLSPDTPHRIVEPAAFRYKVWRVYEDVARELVESGGGIYVPPPAQTLDADGFLRAEMQYDGLHANRHYGDAVLHQVDEILQRMTHHEGSA